jgi:hypothetical protein
MFNPTSNSSSWEEDGGVVIRLGHVRSCCHCSVITLCDYVFTWFDPKGEMSVAAAANRYERLARNLVVASF